MNTRQIRLLALLAAPLLWAGVAAAQTAPTTPPPAADDEVVRLSPFNVNAEADEGYQATYTLAGGRLNSELGNLASSVSVLTRDFLNDIGAIDLVSAAFYLPNADPQNIGSQTMNDYAVNVRGFPSGFLYRNYFISYVNPDGYVTERVESARGPNALVFGDTKAGGTVNVMPKQAKFRNFGSVAYRYTDVGGTGRFTLDVNRKLTDKLALRIAALYQDDEEWVDFSYLQRTGYFGALTWKPFKNTTVRLDAERYTQDLSNRFFGSVLRDNYANWNGTTVYTAANQAIVPGSGTSAIGANYHVYQPGTGPSIVTWTNFRQTTGTGYQFDINPPAYQRPGFPTLPYRGYNIRMGKGHDIDLTYNVRSLSVEQQVGDNLFLEVAGSYARQQRYQRQLATEGVYVDINQNLPDGTPNPNFRKRYTESGQISHTVQENTITEGRVAAAYLFNLGDWSSHRVLVGGAYRIDAYRDYSRQIMRDVAGARFQNPFANPNSIRYRIYEDQRGIPDSLPAGVKVGLWNFFPGEDKDLATGQVAASSQWFKRLNTLVGVRHDKLRTKSTTANVDANTGEFVSYNERQPGREFKPVVTTNAGGVYQLTSWLAPYASYSEGFDTSVVGLMLNPATGIPEVPLPARESEGQEIGVKFKLWDTRISGSLSYYANKQTNDNNTGANLNLLRTNANNMWNIIDPTKAIPANFADVIDYEGDGIELEIIANPTKNWRLSFNLSFPETERTGGLLRTRAYVDANRQLWQNTLNTLVANNDTRAATFRTSLETVDAVIASAAEGRPLIGQYDYTANFFTTYSFNEGRLKGFRVGGGANIRGERYAAYQQRIPGNANISTLTPVYTKGWELFNAMVGYRTKIAGQRVDFQLNIENVFNDYLKRYVSFNSQLLPDGSYVINGNSYVFNASPRRILFTTTVNF